MKVTFLGLGLIGGSIARAIHAGGWTVSAWTPSGRGPAAALAAGVADLAPRDLATAVGGADLVVLAAPPTACLTLLDALAGPAGDALGGAVVTDVASTKAVIVARAAELGLRFVGGHPMAGREVSGFDAADADLLRDRPWVVVPVPGGADRDPDAIARVEALARACGARPVRMDAAAHDAAVAGVSHLPLVLAAALVEAVAGGPGAPPAPGWDAAASLAATGWAGATRLARGDPAMAAGIAATNAGPLAARLRAVRGRLDEWLALLDAPAAESRGGLPDEAVLRDRFERARARLEARD